MGARTADTPKKVAAAGVDIQTSSEGVAIPVVYGRARISPNLIWLGKLAHLGGDIGHLFFPNPGSGFGAASPATSSTFYYFISMMLGICEGPIHGVRTIYKRDTLFRVKDYDVALNGVVQSSNFGGSIYIGTADQPPWTKEVAEVGRHTLSLANRGAGKAPSPPRVFPHLSYMGRQLWPLYQQAQLPNLTMEVFGLKCDLTLREPFIDNSTPGQVTYSDNPNGEPIGANPADIFADILTDLVHGIGFPPEMLGDLADYRLACHAHGFLLSLAAVEQQETEQYLTALLDQSNATARFSDGVLQVLPLWDSEATGPTRAAPEHRLTHKPSWLEADGQGGWRILVVYAFTDSDFLPDSWFIERADPADAFNVHVVEYTNRYAAARNADDPPLAPGELAPGLYETATTEASDLAAIELFGRRDADVFNAHYITDEPTAQALASVRCQNAVANPNRHTFEVPGWRYARLDEGDVVSVPPDITGGPPTVIRVESIEEDEDEVLTIAGVEVITGLHTEVVYERQGAIEETADYDADPGKIAAPVLFEPTAELGGGRLELWIAVTGQSEQWGGCTVWLSEDGGVDYRPVGQIVQRATMGSLETALTPSSSEVDVQLTAPEGLVVELEAFTTPEVLRGTSLCLVDGGTTLQMPYELFSYGIPELTAPNRYTLRALSRGRAGSPQQSHRRGANVVRLDDAILRLALPARLLDPSAFLPLSLKFTSFNQFGGAEQSLEDVPPVAYRAVGTLFRTPVGAIQNLAAQFVTTTHGGQLMLTWDPVQDLRGTIEYEVRRGGDLWPRAAIIGTTREQRFPVVADAVYFVAARVSITEFGAPRYIYGTPASLLIKGTADLVENVVVGYDELPFQWGSYADAVRADAPKLWWRQGNFPTLHDIYDTVTGAAVGTMTGTVTLADVRVPGGVVNDSGFDNVGHRLGNLNQYVTLATDARHDLTGDNWTLWFQVKPTVSAAQRFLYSKGSGAHLTIESNGRLRWLSTGGGTQLDGGTNLYDNQFHQVMLVFQRFDAAGMEKRRLRLMVDGSQEAIIDGATFPVATGTTYLGNQGSPQAGAAFGVLDEFAKLDVALEPAAAKSWRFSALYYPAGTLTRNVLAQQPAVYLKFGEASTARQPDFSGNLRTQEHGIGTPPLVTGLIRGDTDQARSYDGTTAFQMSRSVADFDATFDAGLVLEVTFKPAAVAAGYLLGFHLASGSALTEGPWVELAADGTITVHVVDSTGTDHPVTLFWIYAAATTYHLVWKYVQATGRFRAWVNRNLAADVVLG